MEQIKTTKKLKASWAPKFEQDWDAMTKPESPVYDADFVSYVINEYGSLEIAFPVYKEDYENQQR